MALLEDRSAAFIVRVWCERGDAEQPSSEWRGTVEHVQTGERQFFRHLDAVLDFMKPYLEALGIDAQQRLWERLACALYDCASSEFEIAPSVSPTPSIASPRR